jgi:hypothetical protein
MPPEPRTRNLFALYHEWHPTLTYVRRIALVIAIATIGGVMNSIAGGGTLLTFPALVGLGVPATAANATSTVALLTASMTSMFGYREELPRAPGGKYFVFRSELDAAGGG